MGGRRTQNIAILHVCNEAGLDRDWRIELAQRIGEHPDAESMTDLDDQQLGYLYHAMLNWRVIQEYRLLNDTLSNEARLIVDEERRTGRPVIGTERVPLVEVEARVDRMRAIRTMSEAAGINRGERLELLRYINRNYDLTRPGDMDDDEVGTVYWALMHWTMIQEARLFSGALATEARELVDLEERESAELRQEIVSTGGKPKN